MLSRHRHPQAVHGFVLKGRWRYLEHDWEATEGSYVFEPPGETHTLYVPPDVEVSGTTEQVYLDPVPVEDPLPECFAAVTSVAVVAVR